MKQSITAKLLNKEWIFKCSDSEKDKLHEAALYLDQHMQKLSQEQRAAGYDQITLLAAISLTHELLAEKNKTKKLADVSKKINRLRSRLTEKLSVL